MYHYRKTDLLLQNEEILLLEISKADFNKENYPLYNIVNKEAK